MQVTSPDPLVGNHRCPSCFAGARKAGDSGAMVNSPGSRGRWTAPSSSPNAGKTVKEIVRQQWNFSPPESIREVEEYRVEVSSVTVLELLINPNISGGVGLASVEKLRLS
jgi:hypothetical protein